MKLYGNHSRASVSSFRDGGLAELHTGSDSALATRFRFGDVEILAQEDEEGGVLLAFTQGDEPAGTMTTPRDALQMMATLLGGQRDGTRYAATMLGGFLLPEGRAALRDGMPR